MWIFSFQIIPFLALGLGVDDIFLMAHTYGENSASKHIAFNVRLFSLQNKKLYISL